MALTYNPHPAIDPADDWLRGEMDFKGLSKRLTGETYSKRAVSLIVMHYWSKAFAVRLKQGIWVLINPIVAA